jgi:hypothetical protein
VAVTAHAVASRARQPGAVEKRGAQPAAHGSGATAHGLDLLVVVTDTGAGAAGRDRRAAGEGIGLSNVERRLAAAYGTRASLSFESQPGRGARVEVRIPIDPPLSSTAAPAGARPAHEVVP